MWRYRSTVHAGAKLNALKSGLESKVSMFSAKVEVGSASIATLLSFVFPSPSYSHCSTSNGGKFIFNAFISNSKPSGREVCGKAGALSMICW